MRYYEYDIFDIPERYKRMTHKQLQRRIKFWEYVGKIVSKFDKIFFRRKKIKELNTDIKFYL